jgi:hypothetical protein
MSNTFQITPHTEVHTSFLLYQKLLVRNLFYTPAPNGKTKVAHTKADILNLISIDAPAVAQIGWDIVVLFRSQMEMFLGCTYVWFLLGKCCKERANIKVPLVSGDLLLLP